MVDNSHSSRTGPSLKAVARALSLALGAVILLCGGASAQQTSFPDIQALFDRGKLVVAMIDRDVPPMVTEDDDGELGGFDIALARTIGLFLELPVEFLRTARTYDDVVGQVARGEADIAVSYLSRSEKRALFVYFTQPYLTQKTTLLINRVKGIRLAVGCPSIRETAEVSRQPGQFGVQRESVYAWGLRVAVPDAQPVEFDTLEEMAGAVAAGDLIMSLQGELGARRYLQDNPSARIRLKLCTVGTQEDEVAIAVRPDSPNLVHWLDNFIAMWDLRHTATSILAGSSNWGLPLVGRSGVAEDFFAYTGDE